MLHVFNASLNGRRDSLKNILYLLKPKSNIYYIAALETMKASLISKILSYARSILIKRTSREAGKENTRVLQEASSRCSAHNRARRHRYLYPGCPAEGKMTVRESSRST